VVLRYRAAAAFARASPEAVAARIAWFEAFEAERAAAPILDLRPIDEIFEDRIAPAGGGGAGRSWRPRIDELIAFGEIFPCCTFTIATANFFATLLKPCVSPRPHALRDAVVFLVASLSISTRVLGCVAYLGLVWTSA
jgi:hypothetical protein